MLCSRVAGPAVFALALLAPAAARVHARQGVPETPAPPPAIEQNVLIPMADGVRLAARVYLPAAAGPSARVPVLVSLDPYASAQAPAGRHFAARGFAFVKAWTRGAGRSEGKLTLYLNDAKDGPQIVEWAARQPWSNGIVATWGLSYAGLTQYATALGHPPHLKAQFVMSAADDYHDGAAWSGGALMVSHNLDHMIGQTLDLERVQDNPSLRAAFEAARQPETLAAWTRLPASRQFELFRAVPETIAWAREWLDHPDDDAYWKQVGFNLREHVGDYPDLPIYITTGWMDHFERPTLRAYTALRAHVKAPVYLMVGPWRHQGTATAINGQADYGPAAATPDFLSVAAIWMRRWLSDDRTVRLPAPVRIFVMGTGDGHKTADGRIYHGGFWRDEQEWPLARARTTRYYLHAGGALSTTPPAATESAAPSAYAFDPANPVPTIFTRLGGGWDQRCLKESPYCRDTLPLAARPDVLAFRTEPLAADTEVTGPVRVTLQASSGARDTDFTAKLIDEYPSSADFPDGFALILGDMILRARYRNSYARADLLEPDRVYAMTIQLPATSNVFKAGHRIRLDVSSSNFPKWDVNPNTGEPIGYQTHTVIAYNRIYHDAQHLSEIDLPIVAASAHGPDSMGGR